MDNAFRLIEQAPESFREQVGYRPGSRPTAPVATMPALYAYLAHAQEVALASADNFGRIASVTLAAGDQDAASDALAEAKGYMRIWHAVEALRV